MYTENKAFPLKHLIVMTADGTLDLAASKEALKSIVADPGFDSKCEVLLDLREIDCALTVNDIYHLAEHMAYPNPALPTVKKIAVLVDGPSATNLALNHAQFLEVCATNRGLNLHAFGAYSDADAWLNAKLPVDPKELALALNATGGWMPGPPALP